MSNTRETGPKGGRTPGKPSSKRTAREQLAEQRRQQQAADQRRARLINTVIVLVVIVAVVGIGVAVLASRSSSNAPATAALPATVTEAGGPVVVGKDTAPVTVDMWEDFQCPACKIFEQVNDASIDSMVAAGQVRMRYHMLTFISDNFSNDASYTAANAFGCASDAGKALPFHNQVYANQPKTEGAGWTKQQLVTWGNEVGITGPTWESCVNDQPYAGWVRQVAKSGIDNGISSTPTIFIDGTEVGQSQRAAFFSDPKAFPKAVAAAASASPSPSAS